MTRLAAAVSRFWYPNTPATRLALLRILIGCFALWYVTVRHSLYLRVAAGGADVFAPCGLATLLDGPLPLSTFALLLDVTIALNVLFVLGVAHRAVGPLFALLLVATLTYRNSWGQIYHDAHLLCAHVAVLGITPSANALSIDAWARRRSHPRALLATAWAATDGRCDWRYGWPIRLMCAITAAAYCLAGLAKVLGPEGLAWAAGDTLRGYVVRDGLRKELMGGGATTWTFALAGRPALFVVPAVATLVLELGAPIFLFFRRARRAWAVGMWSLHVGILVVMGITFRYQLSFMAFAPFFAVERLMPRRAWFARLRSTARLGRQLRPERKPLSR